MLPFAQAHDVEDVWRPLTDEEVLIVDGLLGQASAKLRVIVPTIDQAIAAEGPDGFKATLARMAVVNAVKRVLQNPDGILSTSFAIDDYREDNRRDSAQSTGLLYIDPDDVQGLVGRRGAWGTLRMGSAL